MNLIPNDSFNPSSHQDEWEKLKQFTDARIAIGRAGSSIPTRPMLEFQLAHAQAQDAVYQALDVTTLAEKIKSLGLETITVKSQAEDKQDYLKRPDLGRLLDQNSVEALKQHSQQSAKFDVCIVVGDGLSALAIEENAFKLIQSLQPEIKQENWMIAPIVIATGSRVALGDQVCEILNAKMLIMLIGERPGLSSPDSLGIYYTFEAKSGDLDSKRNCISNVRPAGLSIPIATQRLMNLMRKSKNLGYSGVNLKDDHQVEVLETSHQQKRLF